MGSSARLPFSRNDGHWPLAGILVCGALAVSWFIVTDIWQYVSFEPAKFTPYYWPRRYGLIVHISAGLLALTIGMAQVWLGLTARTHALHRGLGRVYVLAVLLGSGAAFYMAATIPPPVTLYNSGLIGLGVAWVVTTSVAYLAVRRGAIDRHREWMIRSYVVTFGFVSFRMIEAALRPLGLGEDSRFSLAAWLCWTVPLLLAQILLRWPRRAPRPQRA